MCPTRHFVYIFYNPVFQLSTAMNEINLFNNATRHFVYIFFNPVFQLSTVKNEINLFNNHFWLWLLWLLPQQVRRRLHRNSCFTKKFTCRKWEMFYLFFPENRVWHLLQIQGLKILKKFSHSTWPEEWWFELLSHSKSWGILFWHCPCFYPSVRPIGIIYLWPLIRFDS